MHGRQEAALRAEAAHAAAAERRQQKRQQQEEAARAAEARLGVLHYVTYLTCLPLPQTTFALVNPVYPRYQGIEAGSDVAPTCRRRNMWESHAPARGPNLTKIADIADLPCTPVSGDSPP